MLEKTLKVLGSLVLLVVTALAIVYLLFDEPLPTPAVEGPDAEVLADRVLQAVNKPAWDTTRYVTWDFGGRQRYLWNRTQDSVRVVWGDHKVDLHTKTITGRAYVNGTLVTGDDARKLIEQAWAHFCNDSFWLAAPFKIRDPGTQRSTVSLGDGKYGLLVSYASGGVTPGDAYLWEFDDGGLPTAWSMWTSIIPVGGVRATWEGYQTLPTGARLATSHDLSVFTLVLSDLAGGQIKPPFTH